ncbi:hypothetical protein [Alteribacter natronophilus]|uniref:hypothetical protein n=1 Tax=Alteribacter natronophilus TaxID=2583810 RepID=UPI00110D47DE|nr:hypothetical protein [Alteribacter natronophilus]TMW73476.1 hypothetical protein FGB90_04030 [Alteribacter natronophilus]
METLDRLVIGTVFAAALAVLIILIPDASAYPYFITATIVFAVSLVLFFLYLPDMTLTWYIRLAVVNGTVLTLMPILEEGSAWLWVSVLYGSIIAAAYLPFSLTGRK